MNSKLFHALCAGIFLAAAACANAIELKEQIVVPAQLVSLIAAKEQLAHDIAAKNEFALPAGFTNYFAAAKAGHAREAQQIYSGLLKDTNSPAYQSPLKQVALDVELALEAYGAGDSASVKSLGDEFMKSLPAGCIYFGGTDAGRGLPTLLCQAPGDPIFVLSQNAFTDARYMEYVRELYGSKIQLPSANEVKQLLAAAGAGKTGFNAYVAESGSILKSIMAKNPGREFYYEQSFPMDDLVSNLSPHGLVMKINRQPLNTISEKDIKADADFWSAKLKQLERSPQFAGDDYIRKIYAHECTVTASVYARRAQSAPLGAERQRMAVAAQQAFDESLALDASSPETVFQYAPFATMVLGKPDAALSAAQTASQANPSNAQLKNLVAQLQHMVSPKSQSNKN